MTATCGNFEITVTGNEALRGTYRCSCGKVVKIRARCDNTAFVPRHNDPSSKAKARLSVRADLLEALESLLIYGDVYASGADGQSPYGRALAAVARAKGVKENG